MRGFEEISITFKGETRVIEPERQLRLIAEIEDALGGPSGKPALMVLTQPYGPSHTSLAAAYGAVLRYAGFDVSDDQVYLSFMDSFSAKNSEDAQAAQKAILALLSVIAPPPRPGEKAAHSKKT